MTDERLRRVERRWRDTGAPDDELRYLVALVRAGRLPRERVELAAYLGHGPAQLLPRPHTKATRYLLEQHHAADCAVLGDPPPPDLPERVQVALDSYLATGSGDWAIRTYVSAASVREGLDLGVPWEWPGVPPVSLCPLCRRDVSTRDWAGRLRRWGTEAAQRAALVLARLATRTRGGARYGLPDADRLDEELAYLRVAVARPDLRTERLERIEWLPAALDGTLAQRLTRRIPEVTVRELLRDALAPWALGRGDPLLED